MKANSVEMNKPESETITLFSIDVNKTKAGQIGVGITHRGMDIIQYSVEQNKVDALIKDVQGMVADSITRVAASLRNKTEVQLDN